VVAQPIAPPTQEATNGLTAVSALNPYMIRWTIEVRVVYLVRVSSCRLLLLRARERVVEKTPMHTLALTCERVCSCA
jgi:hypothetical protein